MSRMRKWRTRLQGSRDWERQKECLFQSLTVKGAHMDILEICFRIVLFVFAVVVVVDIREYNKTARYLGTWKFWKW